MAAPQVVKFTFLQVDPAWRAVPAERRAEHREAFGEVLARFGERMLLNTYSLVGTRGDADLLLWAIGESLDEQGNLHAALNRTPLAAHLRIPHSYLSVARRSQYVRDHAHEGGHGAERRVVPGTGRYLFVYPFWKTHEWYRLPFEERQKMMGEHFRIGHKYPGLKIHTTYAFGLDDPEFVLAFEGDDPQQFVDCVMELRESEARPYTLRDTPIFTGLRLPPGEALARLG